MDFLPKPINIFYGTGLSEGEKMFLDGMRNTAYVCGCKGEDVEFMAHQALKRMGRDDLLPPCERKGE